MPLLAVPEQHVGDLAFGGGVEEVGGAVTVLPHPHVERSIERKGKAALRLIKLHRGDADVHYQPVDLRQTGFGQARNQFGKAARVQHQPGWVFAAFGPRLAQGKRGRIAVKGVNRRASIEQAAGITARTERGIDDDRAGGRGQRRDHFVEQNWDVGRSPFVLSWSKGHLRPFPARACASRSAQASCASSQSEPILASSAGFQIVNILPPP